MGNIKNSFADFTNLYELNKTLRFELKSIGETEKLLEENQVFLTDKIRQKKYEEIKPFLDEVHLDFIYFCLSDVKLNYTKYKKLLDEYRKDKKNKVNEKKKTDEEKVLRDKIVNNFNSKVVDFLKIFWEVEIIKWKKNNDKISVKLWEDWEIEFSNNNTKFLREIWIFDLMKKKFEWKWDIYVTDKETWEVFKNEKIWKKITIFDDWNWWLWYLDKFFNTRENLYKSDGTATALATRIIDENLKKYCENLDIYDRLSQIDELKNKFQNLEVDFWIKLEKFFSLENYNNCILQNDIQKYNDIRWWKVIENNKKIPWLNEYINKYRQDFLEKIPYLQKLDKQILTRWKENFIEQIENESAFEKKLKDFYKNSVKKVEVLTQIFENLWKYNDENYKTIYFSKEAFNTISHKFTEQVLIFEKLVFDELLKDKLVEKKDFDKKEEKYKFPDFISLFYIKKWLENYKMEELFYKTRYYEKDEIELKEMNELNKKIYDKTFLKLEKTNENIWKIFCKILHYEFRNLLSNIIITENWEEKEIWFNVSKKSLEDILESFSLWETNNWIIKDFVDISKTIYQMWKYFALEKKREWNNNFDLNNDFYNTEYSQENKQYWYLEFYNEAYEQIIVPYNLMRNFIAKKPWEDNKKWKLNFENSSLLKWWDKDFESYWSYIFEKDWLYYLGIINWTKLNKTELEKLYISWNDKSIAKRFVYDFQKIDFKNFPRLFIYSINKPERKQFSPAVEKYNLPVESILDIYEKWLHKTENKKSYNYKESLIKMIDYFKLWISKHESTRHFKFVWKNSNEYEDISQFYTDVEKSCYKPYWENINFDELKNLAKEKRLYLFQIYNKNFELDNNISPKNYIFKWNWKDNVHTMYFKWLFSKENLENKNWVNLKLSWWWELFFRSKTEIEKLWKKKDKNLKEIINHKRYSTDKILLHFPIQVNFKENKTSNFNNYINNILASLSKKWDWELKIIWIDRGEKHLAYYSVINQKQEIIESWSLNYIYQKDKNWNFIQKSEKKIQEIRNDEWKITDYELIETWKMIDYLDYWVLLDFKEKKRRLQRQSWKEVEQIKDLKKWYISVVVRKITDLIIEHNAIVVFEDLNMRFKQIRWGIEKSVYQQLEKALIDKLNFLVNKWEKNPEQAWNLLKAFQLTAPIWTFKEMWKQTWIIFYTQANYTSKIDPVTWWRPNLYIKKQKAELNKENIIKFDSIIWNKEKEYFEITYDLKNFQKDKNIYDFQDITKWTLCTCVERYKWNRNLNNNKWWYDYFENLTKSFQELFENFWIKIELNIKEQIGKLDEKWNENFFSQFLDLFSLLCQIRNTNDSEKAKADNKDDFIFSPVEPFFDSRRNEDFWKFLPKNWDDNGAFNIARKWIIILERISKWKNDNEKLKKEWKKEITFPDLFISHKDWDNFTQKNNL